MSQLEDAVGTSIHPNECFINLKLFAPNGHILPNNIICNKSNLTVICFMTETSNPEHVTMHICICLIPYLVYTRVLSPIMT